MGRILSVAVVAGLLAAVVPACATNDQSIFVRNALAPPTNRTNGVCVYTPDPAQAYVSEGVVDVALRDTYDPVLLVGSQLSTRGDDKLPRTEPNRVHVTGAVVRVTDPNGGELGKFTSLGSAMVDPATAGTPSFATLPIAVLDAKTTKQIKARLPIGQATLVVAYVKVFGTTLGGVDVESGEFQFPVRVVNGSLVDFSSGDDPAKPGVDCSKELPSSGITAPCRIGQDEVVPCQLCRGTNPTVCDPK